MDYYKEACEAMGYMRKVQRMPMLKELQNMSQGEMAVLNYLINIHNGASAGELSTQFGLVTSRIAAILNTLTKKGMAERNPDPDDGRRVLVFVTEKGKQEACEKQQMVQEHLAELLEILGEDDAKEFLRMMRKIAEKEKK